MITTSLLSSIEPLSDGKSDENEGQLDPARAVEFGTLVETRRTAAKLSRAVLAERSGLSRNTLLNVEAGKNNPTRATILRLLAVPELGLSREDVPWRRPLEGDLASAPNCWIAPGYEPIKMFVELIKLLNGQGGSVEQTYAYLDPKSALNWFALTNDTTYSTTFRAKMPLEAMAKKVREEAGHLRLDIIALGSGDAKDEVRLVRHILEQNENSLTRSRPDVGLYLVDISQPLLSEGYRHAFESLEMQKGVMVWAVQGNFHHLPRYTQLHYSPQRAHRRRLITMIGNTLGNLDNEPSFFRHCLVGYVPGDLLFLDVMLARAPANDRAEIHRKDAALQSPVPSSYVEWLGGILHRYCRGVIDIKMRFELETSCPVPGSYCLDAIATVKLADASERQFSVFRFKRYEARSLIDILTPLGWEAVEQLPYGPEKIPTKMLLLFRKVKEASGG